MLSPILEKFSFDRTPYIIAEIGANYGGMDTVKKMVRAAAKSGADMVKFQTYRAETIAAPCSFFTFEDGRKVSQFEFFKQHELTAEQHDELDALCKSLNIVWTSTPSHPTDVDFLERYELPFYKTGSDDLTNTPFLKHIARTGRPMLVSTGMSTLDEIKAAVEAIRLCGNENIIVLHCVVSYPSQIEDAKLRVIETLQRELDVPIGLSDHTPDEFTSILATQMGACVIEKHLTLDHALKLPDHEASLDPEQFALLCQRVRAVEPALGSGEKRILPTEEKWREVARKSVFITQDMEAGETITHEHITIRRPSTGLPPEYYDKFMGKKAVRKLTAGDVMREDDVA